jgi:hypothetical protein
VGSVIPGEICLHEVFDRRGLGTRPVFVDIWVRSVHMLRSVEFGCGVRSPRHPGFTCHVLEPLAQRQVRGEPTRELSVDLYYTVHSWAVSYAATQSGGLPAHADRHEVLSQVLRLTWEACLRIDWTRYEAWPTFLESKIGRARIEAARCDDWLSRRERMRRRRFHGELARREQLEQRTLTDRERHAVASAIGAGSTRVDWAQTLLNSRHPCTVAELPDIVDETIDDVTTIEDQVERRELGGIRARCLTEWLSIVGAENQALVTDLSRWSELSESADRDLPARLAHRLEPYTPLLLAMLGDAA